MPIRTELSGCGHYGVCTIMPAQLLDELMSLISKSPMKDQWQNLDVDPYKPFGLAGAMRVIQDGRQEGGEVKLGWNPSRLREAILSHGQLMKCLPVSTLKHSGEVTETEEKLTLAVSAGENPPNGWFIQACFSDPVWDVIESPGFVELLPAINAEIRNWWEDQSGHPVLGQYAFVFQGKDGQTLQVNQPRGNGLWICGSRNANLLERYQLYDHNTDHCFEAFSHVISLCIILDHCRKAMAKK